ncbi:MAG TPA: response regulator [Elusimicrobiota bacterium]|nr:response regulator [Elusimicrobiota bacterium]
MDDDRDMLRVLRWALSPAGVILEAADGAAALRLLKAKRPRLILLDVTMPGMSGLDVLKAARAFDPNVIVVMLTGLSDIDVAKEALDNGARAYITKPFDDRSLCDEIQRLLRAGSEKAPADSGRPWRVAQG